MVADVRFEPTGFHTSRALAAVSGKFVTAVVVPATDGVVGFPPLLVVPFRANVAQLEHRAPSVSKLLSFLPNVTPRLASQSPPSFASAPLVTMNVSAAPRLRAPGPSRLSPSNRTVSEVTPAGHWKNGTIWPAPPGGVLPGPYTVAVTAPRLIAAVV